MSHSLVELAGRPDAYYLSGTTALRSWLPENVNPKIVQEMLGRANISETMDTHSQVLPSMQETAVNALDNALL